MDNAVAQKIFAAQERARNDETYRRLLAEHEQLDHRFIETVCELSADQQAAICDYLGLIGQMHLRLLELACG